MSRAVTILIADDDDSMRQYMEQIVKDAGWRPIGVSNGREAMRVVSEKAVDLVLLDVQMPEKDGLTTLREIREKYPELGVIMVSVINKISTAVEAMKLGAFDFFDKKFSAPELIARINKALDQLRDARELAYLRSEIKTLGDRPMVQGRSPAMQKVIEVASRIASSPVTVLITGESGTGKEVLARYLHERSDRRGRPFVAVNMGNVESSLAASELFGHEKGAFTDAREKKFGKFELANGGTLFLDEIGDLPLDAQAKLLRALQEREIERVGGTRPIPIDVRILCATNRPLQKAVQEGRFREDLYWRLKVVPIELPPLRERREDVRDLMKHFLATNAVAQKRRMLQISEGALQVLERHQWPGNIRELENLAANLTSLLPGPTIEESDLPVEMVVSATQPRQADHAGDLASAMQAFEKTYLRRTLHQTGGNKKRCAERLGIGYSTLKAKLKAYGIGGPDEADEP